MVASSTAHGGSREASSSPVERRPAALPPPAPQVNRRLGEEEKGDPSKGDPAAPHVQFPPPSLCPKCRRVVLGGLWGLHGAVGLQGLQRSRPCWT